MINIGRLIKNTAIPEGIPVKYCVNMPNPPPTPPLKSLLGIKKTLKAIEHKKNSLIL